MKHLHWYDYPQYLSLLALAAIIPVGFHYAVWAMLALLLSTVVKVIASPQHIGNPALSPTLRIAMAAPLLYWGILAVSTLWSSDVPEALSVLLLKASFVIPPLCLLLSDTTYLRGRALRGVGYAVLASVLVMSAVCAADVVRTVASGSTLHSAVNNYTHQHHAYMALYATVAMLFVYRLLHGQWTQMRHWQRALLIATVPILIAFIVYVNSRAGLLAMCLTLAACLLHMVITRRNAKLGIGVAVAAVVVVVLLACLMPGHFGRLQSTAANVEGDARSHIYKCNIDTYMGSPLVGYGVGDYRAIQVAQYGKLGYSRGYDAGFNCHNQYLESLLAAGIPGLLGLLAMLLAPVVAVFKGIRSEAFGVCTAVAVVMFNLLFESMLERQMGLLFIGLLMGVLVVAQQRQRKV